MFNAKKNLLVLTGLFCSATVFSANSGTLFSMEPTPAGSNHIQTVRHPGPGASVIQNIRLKNHTKRARELRIQRMPGVTTLPGNILPRQCSADSPLGAGDTCNLRLRIKLARFLRGRSAEISPVKICAVTTTGAMNSLLCSQTTPVNDLSVSTILATYPPLIATGFYGSDGLPWQYPLMGVSHDLGVSWETPSGIAPTSTSPSPEFNGGPSVVAPTCSGNTCIASGSYRTSYTSGGGAVPYKTFLLSVSVDGAVNFEYPTEVTNPTALSPAMGTVDEPLIGLQQGTCNESNCIVPGYYKDIAGTGRNVVVVGQLNNGTWAWTFPIEITTPTIVADFSEGLGLSSTAFSPSTGKYMAVGTYIASPNNVSKPFLGESSDLNNWNIPNSFTDPTISPDYSNFGGFPSMSCSQGTSQYCIAVGNYYDQQVQPTQWPVAGVNTSGSTWSFPTTFTQPVTSPNTTTIVGGAYTSAHCDDATCAIVGSYSRDTSGGFGPLLGFTWNTGADWTFPSEVAGSSSGAVLNAVTVLSDKTIIAVGYFLDSDLAQKFMILRGTIDDQGGSSWAFLTGWDTLIGLPENNSSQLSSVYCDAENNTCTASGSYLDADHSSFPALFVSNDAGKTWTFSAAMETPDVENPSFSNGALQGVGG